MLLCTISLGVQQGGIFVVADVDLIYAQNLWREKMGWGFRSTRAIFVHGYSEKELGKSFLGRDCSHQRAMIF